MNQSGKYTKLTELTAQRDQYVSDTVKHVLLLASSMFAILISFHSNTKGQDEYKYIFILAIISLSLCIICGIISLKGNIYGAKELIKKQMQFIYMYERGYIPTESIHTIAIPRFYLVAEKFCYLLFIFSILSLSGYTILTSL